MPTASTFRTAPKKTVRVVAAVAIRDRRVFCAQRGPAQARALLWELPGGKVEPGESDAEALRRELLEELGVEAIVHDTIGEATHPYDDVIVHLVALHCSFRGEPVLHEHQQSAWLTGDALDQVAWAPADVPLLSDVRRLLEAL